MGPIGVGGTNNKKGKKHVEAGWGRKQTRSNQSKSRERGCEKGREISLAKTGGQINRGKKGRQQKREYGGKIPGVKRRRI